MIRHNSVTRLVEWTMPWTEAHDLADLLDQIDDGAARDHAADLRAAAQQGVPAKTEGAA
jgi:hypothetical protein